MRYKTRYSQNSRGWVVTDSEINSGSAKYHGGPRRYVVIAVFYDKAPKAEFFANALAENLNDLAQNNGGGSR